MRTIVHNGMRTIVLMIIAKHENDHAQGVPFSILFLSCLLNLLSGVLVVNRHQISAALKGGK